MEVSILNLTKAYGRFRALDDVSLHIPGGMFGLLGPNGAGKTTLMRILTTLLPPTSGKITVGGMDVMQSPGSVRQLLGYIPQEFGFYKSLNAFEILDYIAVMKNIPAAQRHKQVAAALEAVNLANEAQRRVGTFSGGMKQRLGIAQALLGDPALIVVDEPTAGLDPEERIRFRNVLASLAHQRTILLSTHIVADIEGSCSGVAVLNHGRVVFSGGVDDLANLARGQVWQVQIRPEDWPAVEENYPVLSSRLTNGLMQARLLSPENPMQIGQPMEPGLEDGYIAVIGEWRLGTRCHPWRRWPMSKLSASLQRLQCAFRTELRLLTFNWVYLLLHIGWTALLVWAIASDNRSAQALLETTLGRIAIGMLSLFGLFLVGISGSRSQRTRFFELEGTLPANLELEVGRWLAILVALALFLLQPLVFAARRGPIESILAELPTFLGEWLLTIAFVTLAAVWLLARLKISRWAYPLLAAGWLGFLGLPSLLTNAIPQASLINVMRQGVSFYSEVWGRMVYGQAPLWFNLFYLGLLLFFFGLAAWQVQTRRFHQVKGWPIGMLVIALGLAGWSGGNYVRGVQASQRAILTDPQNTPVVLDQQPFTVKSYDLLLDLSNPSSPEFQARLSVKNTNQQPLSSLDFLLNPALQVKESSLPFQRQGLLWQAMPEKPVLPGETLDIQIRYTGRVRKEYIDEGVVQATDFIEPEGVRLTPSAIWYPFPATKTALAENLHDPARIHLQVKSAGNMPFAANLHAVGENTFAAAQARWVFLLGSANLVTEQQGSTTLITTHADLEPARNAVGKYRDTLAALQPFFPDVPVSGLTIMMLGEEWGMPMETPPVDHRPLVITTRYYQGNRMAGGWKDLLFFTVRPLFNDLWVLSGGEIDGMYGPGNSLNSAITRYREFIQSYLETGGDFRIIQAQIDQAGAQYNPVPLLWKIYHQQGLPAIVRIGRAIRQQSDALRRLPADQLDAWMQEAANAR